MSIVLYRVDERLIHGQVVIGWGHELRPARYVVVDDEIAGSGWEQELYALGAPEAETVFVGLEEGRSRLAGWSEGGERTVVLTRDIGTMRRLVEGREAGVEVNLGGLHAGSGRSRALDYLHLTDADRADLRAMEAAGVKLSARDLPDAPRVPLHSVLSV